MNVRWSPQAIRHFVSIREYIARDSEASAAAVATRILGAVELLGIQPQMGRPGRLPRTRELLVSDTPYIIPYRVNQRQIELLAVFDGHRRWPSRINLGSVLPETDSARLFRRHNTISVSRNASAA